MDFPEFRTYTFVRLKIKIPGRFVGNISRRGTSKEPYKGLHICVVTQDGIPSVWVSPGVSLTIVPEPGKPVLEDPRTYWPCTRFSPWTLKTHQYRRTGMTEEDPVPWKKELDFYHFKFDV